jgi:hypothetical protein
MNGTLTQISYLMISPNGHVIVHPTGSISSPSINTTSLNINGTNISVLYQSKADMANYITSGTLTNYVNITSNQTLTGKKTFTGGINTKSQTVSGTTDLNDDILFGVVKVVGSGNIRLPSPVDNAGGRISFYFETDCTLHYAVWSILGNHCYRRFIVTYYCCIIWKASEKLTPMERTGLLCVVSGDTASITATSLGLGNVANTAPAICLYLMPFRLL